MDQYQERALGAVSAEQEEAEARAAHKIGTAGVGVLVVFAIVLDILSVFEIPFADIIAWIAEIAIIGYLYYVGASQLRQVAANVLAWLAELVPILDLLPLYTVGIIIVIAIDRNETLSRVANKIPTKSAKGAVGAAKSSDVAAKSVQRRSTRVSRNRLFGADSDSHVRDLEGRFESLQKRIPGKVLSVPERHSGGVSSARMENVPGALRERPATQISDAYDLLNRQNLPQLEDIVEEEVDVTGEKAVKRAEELASGGPTVPKQVQ